MYKNKNAVCLQDSAASKNLLNAVCEQERRV
jgi:hypothetical protein